MLSNVGMSHVRCHMYLSKDPLTNSINLVPWSLGVLTHTYDIAHGTSQHLTVQVPKKILFDFERGHKARAHYFTVTGVRSLGVVAPFDSYTGVHQPRYFGDLPFTTS